MSGFFTISILSKQQKNINPVLMTGLTLGFKKMLNNIVKKITCQFKINQ
jgi:hypothetical protein